MNAENITFQIFFVGGYSDHLDESSSKREDTL